MAKTKIHQQKDALAAYFRDMLTEAQSSPTKPIKSQSVPATGTTNPTPPETDKISPATVKPTKTSKVHKLLLCKIGGMKLAIPVSALSNIVHWSASSLHQLPHAKDWQLGLLEERGEHVEVVDIRRLLQTSKTTSPAYILLINQPRYGVVCDSISRIAHVEDHQVNWRQDRSHRPWFSGVITDSMHSIVDISALLIALKEGEMA